MRSSIGVKLALCSIFLLTTNCAIDEPARLQTGTTDAGAGTNDKIKEVVSQYDKLIQRLNDQEVTLNQFEARIRTLKSRRRTRADLNALDQLQRLRIRVHRERIDVASQTKEVKAEFQDVFRTYQAQQRSDRPGFPLHTVPLQVLESRVDAQGDAIQLRDMDLSVIRGRLATIANRLVSGNSNPDSGGTRGSGGTVEPWRRPLPTPDVPGPQNDD